LLVGQLVERRVEFLEQEAPRKGGLRPGVGRGQQVFQRLFAQFRGPCHRVW
jgi:hypothetical protein